MGDVLVLSILGIIVLLVIRSMWINHKKGGGCSGCSHKCEGCSAKCSSCIDKK